MVFEIDFPSLAWAKDPIWKFYQESIQKHCLDKNKVMDAINKSEIRELKNDSTDKKTGLISKETLLLNLGLE